VHRAGGRRGRRGRRAGRDRGRGRGASRLDRRDHRERPHPVRPRRRRGGAPAGRAHRRAVVQRRHGAVGRRRAPRRGGGRARGGGRLHPAQGRHRPEAGAEHVLDDRDGPAGQDLRQSHGRPGRHQRQAAGAGPAHGPHRHRRLPGAGRGGPRGLRDAGEARDPAHRTRPGRRRGGRPARRRGRAAARRAGAAVKVLGLISGTSHDGIDAAVVDFDLADGVLHGHVTAASSTPYDPALRARLRAALPPAATTLAEVCALDTLIGQAFADAAAAAASPGGVDAACSHGQTVYHWVEGTRALGTLQIGQPAWIAERLGVPVVSDVRIRDITASGQGAPLVSHLDTLLLAGLPGTPAALNLGGIANVTVPSRGLAWDTGPANALIDAAVVRTGAHPAGYDVDGAIAARGRVDERLLADLLAEPYYRLPPPKTTGKELFHDGYLEPHLGMEPADLVATLTALTARTVADAVRGAGVDTLVVSGGGAANPT